MKRKTTYPYLMVFTALLGLMSIPKAAAERLQGATIAAFAPYLALVSEFSEPSYFSTGNNSSDNQEFLRLKLENQVLRNEMIILKERLLDEVRSVKLEAIPAKVIFRSPQSWNSSLWINVGESDNAGLAKAIIAKNSPVLLGTSVVGVVDYVGKHQSRVRLITDSGLTPSVRVLRGDPQNLLVADNIVRLAEIIRSRTGLFDDPLKQNKLLEVLEEAKKEIKQGSNSWYLAKGELRGNSKPLWRANSHVLQGIGFNYDYPDREGPARDLRSGKSMDPQSPVLEMPIIQISDLLVTTGMDGVFPPNLPVAEVTSIKLLKEGDYYYELEAKPTAGNLDELSLVFVISPSEYNNEELPPYIGW